MISFLALSVRNFLSVVFVLEERSSEREREKGRERETERERDVVAASLRRQF